MRKMYGLIVVSAVILLLVAAWTSRFGVNLPSLEANMLFLRKEAWILLGIGLAATVSALLLLFLDFTVSKSAAFIGWILYFPVIFNVLLPMFVLFFSLIGVFYTPWLFFAELDFANRLINGIIRFPNENLHQIVEMLGYLFIAVGIGIYGLSLYQLLSSARSGETLFTKGLYLVVRHPQYLGIFFWTLGFAICGWRLINYLMWLTLCYSYMLLAEYEEGELEAKFGQEHAKYRNQVPMIIPFLKVNLKRFSMVTSKRWFRLLIYTVLYVVLLLACYNILDSFVIMYR